MAKDIEDFEDFDFDDMDDESFSFGEPQSKKPTNAREAALSSLKDGVTGFTDDMIGDPLASATEFAQKALPNSISSEVYDVKDTVSTIKDEVKKATADIRKAGSTTLKSMSSLMPDNSGIKSLLDKVVGYMDDGSDYNQQSEQQSQEQRQNLEIQTGILEALGNLTPDAKQMALKEQIELNRSKSHQELMATSVSNSQKLLDYTYNVTNNYYRKSLELQYKHYFVSREQLGLLRTSLDTFKNQFENIIKNTALPEVVKIQSTEQLRENIANRGREAIADVVYNDLNPLKTFKEKAVNKIRTMKDDFVEGFQTADDLTDSASMMSDMEEMGFTKSKMAGDFLSGGLKSYLGGKVADRMEKDPRFKERAFNFKNAVRNPGEFFKGLGNIIGGKDFVGSDMLANMAYGTADMFSPSDPRTLATFKKDDPDSAAIFNYRTQNSITTVIPNLLSKIYGEVKSIRTGDNSPEGNEIRWNDSKDTFETLTDVGTNLKSSIQKKISDKMGYQLTGMMDKIDPKKELSKDESAQMLSSLVQYLQETKDTSPLGLVHGDKSFLSYLPRDLRTKVSKQMRGLVKGAKNDHYAYSDLSYNLKSIGESIPNLVKESKDLYKTGNKEQLEKLGLMTTDLNTNTSYVDRNGVFKYINEAIKEHGLDGLRTDVARQAATDAYSGNKTKAQLEKERKDKEKLAKSYGEDKITEKARQMADDIAKTKARHEANNSNNAFKQTMNNVGDTASNLYNSSIDSNVNNVKHKVNEATDKAKGYFNDAKASEAGQYTINLGLESEGFLTKSKRKLQAMERLAKRKYNKAMNSDTAQTINRKFEKNKEKVQSTKAYKSAKEKIDKSLNFVTTEYVEKEKQLDDLVHEYNINISVKELRGKLTKEDLNKLYDDTLASVNSKYKTSKEKLEKTYDSIKDKSAADIVNNVKSTSKGYFNDAKEIVNDQIKGKINVKSSNDLLSASNTIKHSDTTKIKSFYTSEQEAKDNYKEMDIKTENSLREMYFRSEAYLLGNVKSFKDYVLSFGFKPKDNIVNPDIVVSGMSRLAKLEAEKQKRNILEKLKDSIMLKKLTQEDDDAMRFEFYNSPEYKAGAIDDYHKWLKDKGYKSFYAKPLFTIKSLLKKTRAFDKMVFNKLVANPLKAIAKAPIKAAMHPIKTLKGVGKAVGFAGKVAHTAAKPLLHAADGIASTVGMGFYGVTDNKYIAKAKDAIKYRGMSPEEIAFHKEREETLVDKGLRTMRDKNSGVVGNTIKGVGKGLWYGASGIGSLGLGASKLVLKGANKLIPFSSDHYEPTKAEIMKKGNDNLKAEAKAMKKQEREEKKSTVDGKEEEISNEPKIGFLAKAGNLFKSKPKNASEAKVKASVDGKSAHAFNDVDGSGRRDGSWEDKLDKMKADEAARKAAKISGPSTPSGPAPEKKSLFDMLKGITGVLGTVVSSIGSVGGAIIAGVLGFKTLMGGLLGGGGFIGKTLTGGFNLLGKVPTLLASIGTKIMGLGSSLAGLASGGIAAVKGGLSAAGELVTAGVDKVKGVASKVVGGAKELATKVTPESIKAFFNRIKTAITKKLGKKAGVKLLGSFAAKVASRAVPIAGGALLTYDAAMITKDMVQNGTDFGDAVSKQLLGFNIFNPDEPVLDEDGQPIKPDETYSSDDVAMLKGTNPELKEAEKANEDAGNNPDGTNKTPDKKDDKPGFWSKITNSVTDGAKDAYKSGKSFLSSGYEAVKKGITTAVEYGKEALGGLVGSIPFPSGNGTWKALKDTIVGAAKAVGVDEKLMGVMGAIESGFNYTAKAPGGSASGIFQFIDKTWKTMLSKYGSKYDIPKDTPQTEPRANALMGAEYLKENMNSLKSVVNSRDVNYTDAYMAHFLGPGGAKKFITAMDKDPGQNASALFSSEASNNKSIFYVGSDTSKPRTLGDIYNMFTNRINEKAKSYGIEGVATSGPVPTTTTPIGTPGIGGANTPASTPTTGTGAPTTTTSTPTVTSNPDTVSSGPKAPIVPPPAPPVSTPTVTTNNTASADHVSVAKDGNEILKGMSSTLISSLEVQQQMARALEAIANMGSKSNGSNPNAVVRDFTETSPTYKTNANDKTNYNMQDVPVDLSKKKY